MESSLIDLIETGNQQDFHYFLDEFNIKYEEQFGPVGLSKDIYKRFWKHVLNFLSDSCTKRVHLSGLKTLRILSRDKSAFNEVIEDDHLKVIVRLAGLVAEEEELRHQHNHQIDYDVITEAEKCLSNMIYNSACVQRLCCANSCIRGLVWRLRSFRDPELPAKVKCFDMRILFLLTAFCADIRPTLRSEYHCLTYLTEILEEILKTEQDRARGLSYRHRIHSTVVFSEEDSELICDVLKVLYNLVLHVNRSSPDEEEEAHCVRLVAVMRGFLLAQGCSPKRTDDVHSNSVNLLLVMPPKLYPALVQPMPGLELASKAGFCGAIGGLGPEPDDIVEYDGQDVSAVVRLLEFLHRRLKNPGLSAKEALTPILTLLVEMTQQVRVVRKFVRLKVLPPLRDVSRRPEEGDSIRNKLCLLMTSPIPDLKYLSATFLFVLCKESVDRLIKYTGYGNAAGLLASRGLMMNRRRRPSEADSSESEDSETEEYERMKDKVNPVTGRFEPPRPSPLEGMTEEQKEYEAMKLVNALDKLSRESLIQPCRVGEDGRPRPVEHVLQLQQQLLRERETLAKSREE